MQISILQTSVKVFFSDLKSGDMFTTKASGLLYIKLGGTYNGCSAVVGTGAIARIEGLAEVQKVKSIQAEV